MFFNALEATLNHGCTAACGIVDARTVVSVRRRLVREILIRGVIFKNRHPAMIANQCVFLLPLFSIHLFLTNYQAPASK